MQLSLKTNKDKLFFLSVMSILFFYLLYQYFFIPFSALSADEFVFARHIYDYTHRLPYRDFSPYKTVLGYYLLSIPLYFSHGLLAPLFYIKAEIALINGFFLTLIVLVSRSFFSRIALILTISLILANHLFLIYSTDLRVDMLTAWFGLMGPLLIIQKRFKTAGWITAIAFLVSQKALWYWAAINGALCLCSLLKLHPIATWRNLIYFNLYALLGVMIYTVFWIGLSDPATVLQSMFHEAYTQSKITTYLPIYTVCWNNVLNRGPLLYLLLPLTLFCLSQNDLTNEKIAQRIFIFTFAFIMLFLFTSYKQPFPYNFVLTTPAFFLIYAEYFTWLGRHTGNTCHTGKVRHTNACHAGVGRYPSILIAFSYFLLIIFLVNSQQWANIYNLIALLGLLQIAYLYYQSRSKSIFLTIFSLIIFITGIATPLMQTIKLSHKLNGDYQQYMLHIAAQLIKKDEGYLAGIPYFYYQDQPLLSLTNLISPALQYLYEPNDELKPLLIPSLYLTTQTAPTILSDLRKSPIKIIIENYRILSLPRAFRNYIDNHYINYYGPILIYAPKIKPHQAHFYIKFSDKYRIAADDKTSSTITIDHRKITNGQILYLNKGKHLNDSKKTYRIIWVPKIETKKLKSLYRDYSWIDMLNMLRPIVS